MSELVRMNVEIQRADNLGVRRGRPKVVRIINRAVFNHLQQTLETAFGKWFSIFHVQHIKALCALALFYKLCKQRGRYRDPENAVELIVRENIDGLFIGRSAWQAEKFEAIIRSVLPLWREK